MQAVIYYSNTGESAKIARYFAAETGYMLTKTELLAGCVFEDVILVFPVYCQNIPDPVKDVLIRLRVERLVLVATYGRMCYGNVLREAQLLCAKSTIIAAAYLPTKHSYLQEESFADFDCLSPLLEKIKSGSRDAVDIPASYKNPFADFAKEWRSRMGVKIWRDKTCLYCNLCEKECAQKGMINGKTNKNCIRCLKCVTNCPVGALRFSNRLPMRLYLKKVKTNKVVLYV